MRVVILLIAGVLSTTIIGQQTDAIDHKGTISIVDNTPDAFNNNPDINSVILVNLSDGVTLRPLGTEFCIKDSGNVGIGTNNPQQRLDIAAGDIRLRNYQNTRDNSATNPINNILFTDINGNVLTTKFNTANTVKHAELAPVANFNCNTAVATPGAFFGTVLSNEGAITQTSPTLVTINQSGFYDIALNAILTTSGNANSTEITRTVPKASLYINAIETRIKSTTSYIRSNSGHNTASWNFQCKKRLNAGDTVQIMTLRTSNSTGDSTLDANFTSFLITRIGI